MKMYVVFDVRCLRLSVASSQLQKDTKRPRHLWRPKKSFEDIRAHMQVDVNGAKRAAITVQRIHESLSERHKSFKEGGLKTFFNDFKRRKSLVFLEHVGEASSHFLKVISVLVVFWSDYQ